VAVQSAIADGIAKVRRAGKTAGILSPDPQLARHYLGLGALFVAVGVDTTLLASAARNLARSFKDGDSLSPERNSGY
jgi:4-hydroxy-2-oxoheptanedioate aldolase